MIGYQFGEVFQLRILSFLVRNPERALGIIEPSYFGSPFHADIAQIACKYSAENRKTRLSKATLKELVKQSLSRKELRNWSYYKKAISAVYRIHGSDSEIIFQQALEFARCGFSGSFTQGFSPSFTHPRVLILSFYQLFSFLAITDP